MRLRFIITQENNLYYSRARGSRLHQIDNRGSLPILKDRNEVMVRFHQKTEVILVAYQKKKLATGGKAAYAKSILPKILDL